MNARDEDLAEVVFPEGTRREPEEPIFVPDQRGSAYYWGMSTTQGFKPLVLFLSRNPMPMYGGGYTLTTYHPKNYEHGVPCWWYWREAKDDSTMLMSAEDISNLLSKVGLEEIEPGSCINLNTGEVTRLVAPTE